jgi:hypothetical protein
LEDLRADGKVTWRKFRLEHVHCDHVDDEHPDGAVQQLGFVFDECHGAETLALQPAPVWVCSPQLSVYVLLEFLHVEQLQHKTNGSFAVSSNLNRRMIRSSDPNYIEVTNEVTIELEAHMSVFFDVRPPT